MLRGLWLAVVVMAFSSQWIGVARLPPPSDLPLDIFIGALAAAVLYAVGAAATMFSVEHEEETYEFLSGLPATWLPVFAGKLLVAAARVRCCWRLLCCRSFRGLAGRAQLARTGSAVPRRDWGCNFRSIGLGHAVFAAHQAAAAAVVTLVVGAVTVNHWPSPIRLDSRPASSRNPM